MHGVRNPIGQGAGRADLLLQTWLSPAFPVGGFAYSHGLEAAVESGDIANAEELREWLIDLVEHGSLRNDLVLLAAVMRTDDAAERADINALAIALAPSKERRLEMQAQGDAFIAAARAAWPCAGLDDFAGGAQGAAYPVAIAVAAAGHGIATEPACRAFGLAFIAQLVSAAVRLGPIGQTDGQKVIAALIDPVSCAAAFAASSTLEDLGGAAMRSDIASMRHETQYSRLFRS